MQQIVYVGRMAQVEALNIPFTHGVPVPVSDRQAEKLRRSPDFITLAEHTARQSPAELPETEPVVTAPVQAPQAPKPRPLNRTRPGLGRA